MSDPYAPPVGSPGFTDYYLNQTPDAAFWNYLGQNGYTGNGNRNKYAQGQESRQYSMYQAQAASNPNQGFYDYLQQNKPDFNADFMAQDPTARGDTSGRYLTPRARFVNAY